MQLDKFLKDLITTLEENLHDLHSMKKSVYDDILQSMSDNKIPFTDEMLDIDEDFDDAYAESESYSQYEPGHPDERYLGEDEDFE